MQSSRGILDENHIEHLIHLCRIGNHTAPGLNLDGAMSNPNPQGSDILDLYTFCKLDYERKIPILTLLFRNRSDVEDSKLTEPEIQDQRQLYLRHHQA